MSNYGEESMRLTRRFPTDMEGFHYTTKEAMPKKIISDIRNVENQI